VDILLMENFRARRGVEIRNLRNTLARRPVAVRSATVSKLLFQAYPDS
jgi:hypothetical protein